MMKLLVVASEPMEFPGILSHSGDVRQSAVPVDWARTARLGSHDVLLIANGAGRARAGAALDGSLDVFRPEALVSTGFCGALAPELGVGDVVVATEVAGPKNRYEALPVESAVAHHTGAVRTIDHIARTAGEKESLRATGACAVEMEAEAVAERAQARGLPFYCVKAVTDLAGENMANDFNAALRSDGHFDTIVILRNSLRHPRLRLPELFRLRGRSSRAARALGDFLANCQF
jgi:adenosylhomocysteine nucleosidase